VRAIHEAVGAAGCGARVTVSIVPVAASLACMTVSRDQRTDRKMRRATVHVQRIGVVVSFDIIDGSLQRLW
jgi:hypothetical protein